MTNMKTKGINITWWRPDLVRAIAASWLLILGAGLSHHTGAKAAEPAGRRAPVPIIFDTDVGNDVDDVLALAVLHALQSRGECKILGVTITKPDELAGPFVDALNTFYGRPDIPIGFTHAQLTNEPSKFLKLADAVDDGHARYPHRLKKAPMLPKLPGCCDASWRNNQTAPS